MEAITQLKSALAGRYEVEREIGAGGMATVYLARDLRHDAPQYPAWVGVQAYLNGIAESHLHDIAV